MRIAFALVIAFLLTSSVRSDNELTDQEKKEGWLLLFDGNTLDGWMTSAEKPSKRPVEEHAINPHKCGHYMMTHEKQWGDFILALDYKLSKNCNSGVFVRTFPLKPRPGKDTGFNGIEVQLLDSTTAGLHDSGAFYDLVKPTRNTQKPLGEWNHMVITCNKNILAVELNGEKVNRMDLDDWPLPNRRPDGSEHKFDFALKDHPRRGYIGLQDHGADCWFKNIKLLPLNLK